MAPAIATAYKLRSNDLVIDNEDKRYILKVRDMEDEDRPREKLIENGPASLTSQELLAIILNTGTKREEVMAMSNRILKEYGEKSLVSQTNPKFLEREFSIPQVKACQIVACFELGRRYFQKQSNGSATVHTAKQAYEYFKDMRELPKEQFRAIYLNSHYRVVHDEVISIGTLTASIVHPREVFKPAIERLAVALIVAHNHPSGSIKPTQADIELSRQLHEAGKILGIELLDHLVIAGNKFASIALN